jgi:hypothetical protein
MPLKGLAWLAGLTSGAFSRGLDWGLIDGKTPLVALSVKICAASPAFSKAASGFIPGALGFFQRKYPATPNPINKTTAVNIRICFFAMFLLYHHGKKPAKPKSVDNAGGN